MRHGIAFSRVHSSLVYRGALAKTADAEYMVEEPISELQRKTDGENEQPRGLENLPSSLVYRLTTSGKREGTAFIDW